MKKKINILVTGIGGDIGIGIINILKDINYHNSIVGCDINEFPASKNLVNTFLISPSAIFEDAYLDFITTQVLKYNIDLIIPSSEIEIKVLTKNKSIFNSKVKLLVNHQEIVETFMDKLSTISFLDNMKIKVPKTYDLDTYNNELKYPFFLKHKFTQGSKGIFEINDDDDFNYYAKKNPHSLVQEMIGSKDQEYTICIFSDGDNIYNIAFRRLLGLGSLSRYVELVEDQQIDYISKKLAQSINLKGSINLQVRKNNDHEYIPFEINPRLSSTLAFRHHFGFCDLKWWIDILFGSEVTYTKQYSKGIGIKTVHETYFNMEET